MRNHLVGVLAVASLLLLALSPAVAAKPKAEKITATHAGKERVYFLYIPQGVASDAALPAVILLHGSGRDGMSLLDPWRKLADQEGIVLIAPNALNPASWHSHNDSADFLGAVLENAAGRVSIDRSRLYLFGHSAGACYALMLPMTEDQLFAAVAVHAGSIHPDDYPWTRRPQRKTPMHLQVGTEDAFFPLSDVQATYLQLRSAGFEAELVEIPRHTHDYYSRSAKINAQAWEFLKQYSVEPKVLGE